MFNKKNFFVVSVFAFLFLFVYQTTSNAIPYFARKYEMSCSTCHVIQPRLNEMGRKFQAQGYKMADDEETDIKLSDLKTLPLSIKIEPWFVAQNAPSSSTDFQLHALELQSAGALPLGGAYFFEKYLEERGDSASAGDVLIRMPFGKNGYYQMGQFTILNHLPDPNRLTINRNLVYNSKVSIGGKTNAVRLRDRQRGVEFGIGTPDSSGNVSISVFNGNGTGKEVKDISDDNEFKNFSVNAYKYFDNYSIGIFGYGGDSSPTGTSRNRFVRTGLTTTFFPNKKIYLEGIFSAGRDKNLLNDNGKTKVKSSGYNLEADYFISPKTAVIGRYGQLGTSADGFVSLKSSQTLIGIVHSVNDYIKLSAEYIAVPGNGNDGFYFEYEFDL